LRHFGERSSSKYRDGRYCFACSYPSNRGIARVEVRATGNNYLDTGTFDEATYNGICRAKLSLYGIDFSQERIQGMDGILQTILLRTTTVKFMCKAQKNADVMTLIDLIRKASLLR
jgi:hypothetical protein